jgi:hypothetical protein
MKKFLMKLAKRRIVKRLVAMCIDEYAEMKETKITPPQAAATKILLGLED